MTGDDTKQVIRKVYDAIGRGDFDALRDSMADDMVEHEEFPGLEPNKEGVLEFFRYLRSAFPDLRMSADLILADGDMVAVLGTMSGTHRGEFMDIPATGNRLSLPFGDFFRVRDGKIAEHWGVTDTGAMMEQLGATGG